MTVNGTGNRSGTVVRTAWLLAALAGLACAARPAAAAPRQDDEKLTPVESLDRASLMTSLHRLDPGLRQPVGFDSVYRAPDGEFMRVQGGLYAVFPRSVYVPTGFGLEAVVPPDTTFYIGEPPGFDEPAAPPAGRIGEMRPRVDTRLSPGRTAPTGRLGRPAHLRVAVAPDEAPGPAVVADDAYRRQRLDRLLQRAARAEIERRDGVDQAARGRSSSSSK
ncbi:MAG: hypothetical protein ACYTG1_07710 [Planctomycetota bacterium]|jgi:hypothetical protein